MIERIKEWWRQNHSFKWVDNGSSWLEYETSWQTDHAASVRIKTCQPQVHPDTGDTRVRRRNYVGATEPIRKFDEEGYLHLNGHNPIRPTPDSEPVINPQREAEEPDAEIVLGDEDDE